MASPFSGSSARKAAVAGADIATINAQQIANLISQGKGEALGAIDAGQPLSLEALANGYGAAKGQYGDAILRYQPWTDAGTKALGTYQDSLGLNGGAGNDNAVSAFQASPGYRYQVDQATDAVARKNAALGILGSGNTQQAIGDRAQQLANADYGAWQDRLNGLSNTGLQATGAQAGLQKGIGDLDAALGTGTASIYDTNAARRAGVIGNATNGLVSNQSNFGNQVLALGQQAAQAGQDASANKLNFGLGLAGTALNLAGLKTTGGGSVGGSIISSILGGLK